VTTARAAGPLSIEDGEAIAGLRTALEAADFTVERTEDKLDVHTLSIGPSATALHLRRLAGDEPFEVVARLFLLGAPVDRTRAAEVLAPVPLERLAGLGLLELDADEARAHVRLLPHGDYYLAADLAPDEPDYVPGIHAPSVTLAKLAVRRRVERSLDLGTGCGIQALLAAKHSEGVIATDINARALNFAAFNARLNAVDNVDLRRGDTFDPVAGERFDLIVSNPPYVISPDADYAYRDSGLPADSLCRAIVERVPEFLTDGGFAHLLVSWVHEPEGDWAAPLRAWVEGRGCDTWLMHYKTEDPLTHAANWLSPIAEQDHARYEESLDRWLAYLRELGIEAIGYGAIVLRRRHGESWIYAGEAPWGRLQPASDHTLRVFAAQDLLAGLRDDRELLQERLALVDKHRLVQDLTAGDGAFTVEAQKLVLDEGPGFEVGLDRYAAALLPHFERGRPLHEVLERAAESLGLDADDRGRYAAAAPPVVRRLLELGFLTR
jgi:hypothetical protein